MSFCEAFPVIPRNASSFHMFGATVATLACHPVARGCYVLQSAMYKTGGKKDFK